jgi:phosphatidate cytidylyltransferase
MTTRIISAAVAIVVAIVLLLLHNTFVFNLALGFLSITAVYEIFKAAKLDKFAVPMYICFGYAAFDVIMPLFYKKGHLYFLSSGLYFGLFILGMCLMFLKDHDTFGHKEFFCMIGVTYLVCYSFQRLLLMSTRAKGGVFLIVITLCAAWLADSGAYFAGTFFGKTKLCPQISPKKTVEGLIGGVLANGVFMIIISLVYDKVLKGQSVNYLGVFIAGMLAAVIGLVGDLTASVIKRQTGIKDYGKLMPGHGGVMDRFDSVLLVAPFMYYMVTQGWILK